MANPFFQLPLTELSRQPMRVGTSCLTDPAGQHKARTEEVVASALVRLAVALERQTELLAEPNPLTLAEYADLYALANHCRSFHRTVQVEEGLAEADKLLRLCDLVQKLLRGMEGGVANG